MKIGAGPRLVVAVPIKDLTHAKQRLTSVLCVGERGELARAMLGDVLRALAAADLGRVWVVTRDPAAAAIARALGAEPVAEAENRGHTAAVALAQAEAARRGSARGCRALRFESPARRSRAPRRAEGGLRQKRPGSAR